VLVSAAITPRGTPGGIVDFAEEGRFEIVVSAKLISEAEDVLMRPKFRRYLSEAAVSAYLFERLPSFASTAEDPEHFPARVPADPKDDYVVALAVNAAADLIVSGDGHLLDLEDESLPEILRPADFLSRLRG